MDLSSVFNYLVPIALLLPLGRFAFTFYTRCYQKNYIDIDVMPGYVYLHRRRRGFKTRAERIKSF